ncbi:MAG: tetraacyldisaccharide 4'-kinase [Thermodesulfobacteriota bacterium]|nr:tetraacyldisaccharide 4'-kinase [Thermodesulfobacteriota bacterium]
MFKKIVTVHRLLISTICNQLISKRLQKIEKRLRQKIEKAMAAPVNGSSFFFFDNFFLLVSKIYMFAVKFRVFLYSSQILKSRKIPCFVISIGNIIVGGTGKTPMTLYVAELIEKLGYSVAVVSRGYKGRFEKNGGIVSDGSRICCTPVESGDEPYMIAKILKIPVVAGKNRYDAAMTAKQHFNPDVIILDDAFQHLAVKRDLNLLLLDCNLPFGNGELLPRGRLREPVSALKRSDALILTRCDKNSSKMKENQQTLTLCRGLEIETFRSSHIPFIYEIIDKNGKKIEGKAKSEVLTDICGKSGSGFLFSGIANNADFRTSCEKLGIKIAGFVEFSDHFWYTKADFDRIKQEFRKSKADFIVTTEKDYVKIEDRSAFAAVIVVIGVRVEFEKKSMADFELLIKNKIESYCRDLVIE